MSRNVLSGIILIATLTSMGMKSSAQQSKSADANSWWLTPHRLLQTNLREIDATMDTDKYVREVKEFGANIVLFNVGGIVANYPTELDYHWRNTFMKGDLVGQTLRKLHKAGIKMIGRFDFSKINQKYAVNHPEWLYVSEKGEHVNYNGQVHTCVMGGLEDFDLVQLRGDFHEYELASGTDQMLRLIHDVMYGPPEKCYYRSVSDIPALLGRKHGHGMAASFPFQIGAMYREWGNLGHPMLAVGTLDNLLETGRRLKIESSPLVEATHRRDPKGRFEWIALYNHSGRIENSFHPPIPIDNIRIGLKTSRPIKRVTSLTNRTRLTPTAKSSDEMQIILPRLNVSEVILVEYAS